MRRLLWPPLVITLGCMVFLAPEAGVRAQEKKENGHAAEQPQPVRLRILTYNIHHAVGIDGKLDLDRIAGVIRAANPDIVALQEVDQSVPRSGGVDQMLKLAGLAKMRGLFAKSIPLDGGSYGNGLLTRLPVMARETLALPGAESRSVLVAILRLSKDDPKSEIAFLVTHFPLQAGNRLKSTAVISSYLTEHSVGAAILAGDLNATPASPTMRAVYEDWTDACADAERATVPVGAPRHQIDYILFRSAPRWKVISTEVLDEVAASDHRALLVTLEWNTMKVPD